MIIADYMVLVVALLPYVLSAIAKNNKAFDNADPRNLSVFQGRQKRAYNAQLNGFEIFPFFAFSVLLAQFSGASVLWLNILAVAFVVLRIAHAQAYLNDKPSLRSGLFTAGLLCVVAIFFLPLF